MISEKDKILLIKFLTQWSKQGYPFVDETTHIRERETFLYLYSQINKGNKQADEVWNQLADSLVPPQLIDFDYKKHIENMVQVYGGMNERQYEIYQENVFDNVDSGRPSMHMSRFVSSRFTTKLVDKEQEAVFLERAQKVVQKLISADGQPNKKFALLLQNTPIIFCFENQKFPDGGIESVLISGKIRPVITLTSGCMQQKNEGLIAGTIAHELGHFMDGRELPSEFLGGNKLGSECFADAMAYRALLNAGYSAMPFIDTHSEFAEAFIRARGETHPMSIVHKTRAKVLKQIAKYETPNLVLQKNIKKSPDIV